MRGISSLSARGAGFSLWSVVLVSALAAMVAVLSAAPAQARATAPGAIASYDRLAFEVLADPNVTMYPGVEYDIWNGIANRRILKVIDFAASRHQITLSVIKTGYPYASPTLGALGMPDYPNAHHFGRAVDIAAVDGALVSPANDSARTLARQIHTAFAPEDLGSPWRLGPGSFTDADHKNHIHVGWATWGQR